MTAMTDENHNWQIRLRYFSRSRPTEEVDVFDEMEGISLVDALEVFMAVVGPVPPRVAIEHFLENGRVGWYEVELVSSYNELRPIVMASVSWREGLVRECANEFLLNPPQRIRALVQIEIPSDVDINDTSQWDWEEIADTGVTVIQATIDRS